ncbi:MAG: NAD(+) synthase, partial [Proteobacteria bacterium]|nr:NAD(+) synthase [Pseudomonadota bacterium]
VVACLVAGMVHRGCAELGLSLFCRQLGGHFQVNSREALCAKLLHCVYQKTANSSQHTQEAAESLAREMGASYYEVSVQEYVDQMITTFQQTCHKQLNWAKDSITLQNIQARMRSPFPWMIANAFSGILLCTANRSEAAVGYMTTDGDMSGGLAPIAGIDKSFLLSWLAWVAGGALAELKLLPALKKVLALPPKAELVPLSYHQTDEGDLMPYDVLSVLEKLLICDKRGYESTRNELYRRFQNIPNNILNDYLTKFQKMWQKSQWKRERLPVGFHVDQMNVDPRSWCRYPVLTGDAQGQRLSIK